MSVDEIRPAIESWSARGLRWGEALLTSTWRSAPRRPGARFLLGEDGEIAGNVSSGCVEADLAERLAAVLRGGAPGVVEYGVSDEAAHEVGLACGGQIELALVARAPGDPVWPPLFERRDRRAASVLATAIGEDGAGRRWLLAAGGDVVASDGPDPPPAAAARAAADPVAASRAEVADGVFVEVLLPPHRLVVVGATPIGAALARLALAAGIDVTVIEPRPAYARSLAADGVAVDADWPLAALPARAPDVSTAVAVVAHDGRIDDEALAAALASPARYVGLLGGGRTRRARFEALRGAGVPEADIERIRAPIGLDLGADAPAEIAVGILAEVIASWRGAPS